MIVRMNEPQEAMIADQITVACGIVSAITDTVTGAPALTMERSVEEAGDENGPNILRIRRCVATMTRKLEVFSEAIDAGVFGDE